MKLCKRCGVHPPYNPESKADGRGAIYREHCLACARTARAILIYVPFDELIEQKPVKVLRALRLFGDSWVERADLYEAMDLPSWSAEPKLLTNYHQAFTRLVKEGLIERRIAPHRWGYQAKVSLACWYRITAAGLADLERRMRHAQIDQVATDAELDEPERPLHRRRRAA